MRFSNKVSISVQAAANATDNREDRTQHCGCDVSLCRRNRHPPKCPNRKPIGPAKCTAKCRATLTGARVIHAQELAGILSEGKAILIDAAAAPRRPETLASGAIWKPVPHNDIAGSIWMPEIGSGKLTPEEEAFYRNRLNALTAKRPRPAHCFLLPPAVLGKLERGKARPELRLSQCRLVS